MEKGHLVRDGISIFIFSFVSPGTGIKFDEGMD
jgi:hypothetical protein